ncbi:MAG: hypothetical protein DRQ55_09140 [Planctomycetota bacterium]|nr:MAG: hypothetical protein DRQ55_09140 [Planctomycetota bacterium]
MVFFAMPKPSWTVLLLVLTLASCAEDPPARASRNVLLVTVDTLRADALGFGGAPPAASPRLDRLASESLVFTNAFTQATHTHAALSSIMTGLVPPRHGVFAQHGKLASDVQPIATLLHERGYATGSFVANLCPLQEIEGTVLHDGWDERYCGMDMEGVRHGAEQYLWDEDVVARARDWISAQTAPWFCWVHLMDPHGEHRPPPDLWNYAEDPPPTRRAEYVRLGKLERQRRVPPEEELVNLRARYAAEVQGIDRLVGSLVDFADALPDAERPALLVTADHGEEFFETWPKVGHGLSLTEGVLHVPLLVRADSVLPGLNDDYVSTLQVAPTILELVGAEAHAAMDGESLLASSASEGFAVSFCGSMASLRTGRTRYYWDAPMLKRSMNIAAMFELSPHLRDAPWLKEARSVARYDPAAPNIPEWQARVDGPATAEIHDRLHLYLVGLGRLASEHVIEDAEFDEQLRALGYMGNDVGR